MASSYNSDDTFNVIEDHIRQALVADAKLGSGGALEIKTWEEELREDLSSYGEHELPAGNIDVTIQSTDQFAVQGDDYSYLAHIVITLSGAGSLTTQVKDAKYYAARVCRVLQQQHYPSKQLASLPADLDGGETGGVKVVVNSAVVGVGASERNPNVLRGMVEVFATVSVGFQFPED